MIYIKEGISDKEVYSIAANNKRIVVTYNIGDFKNLARKSSNSGVIGISQGIPPDQLDKKLNALLSKNSPKSLYGKYTSLRK